MATWKQNDYRYLQCNEIYNIYVKHCQRNHPLYMDTGSGHTQSICIHREVNRVVVA